MTKVFNPAKFFILGFEGLEPSEALLELLREYPPAGFLFLGQNFHDLEQLCTLTATLKATCGQKIILAVDQEPGRVQRFKGAFPLSKKPSHYLKQGNMAEFRAWCAATADMLASAGMNMNLAPVVDLLSPEIEYPVLKDRAFGQAPDRVAEFAGVLIEEFKSRRIASCVKHFPGLGSGAGDPHEALTHSNEPLERFLDFHWKPFKAAVRAGVDCVMTTHLIAPAIDPDECATYSANTVSHLRNSIGHHGLVISDDLYMAGANTGGSIGRSAEKSIRAGHNLLIISKTIDLQAQAIKSLRLRFDEDPAFRSLAVENEKKVDAFINAL
jgi:beta-N-acetylhexosaminidase